MRDFETNGVLFLRPIKMQASFSKVIGSPSTSLPDSMQEPNEHWHKFAGKKKEKADKKEARKARKQGGSDAATAGLRRAPPTREELALVGAHVDTG